MIYIPKRPHILKIESLLAQATDPGHVFAVSRRHNPFSLLVRSAEPGGRWGHTAFLDYERGKMNEALMFKGVVETELTKWPDPYSSYEFFYTPVPRPDLGILFAREQVGKRYDYAGAAGVLPRKDWQDEEKWYCSEKETMICHVSLRILFRDPRKGVHPHEFWRVAL